MTRFLVVNIRFIYQYRIFDLGMLLGLSGVQAGFNNKGSGCESIQQLRRVAVWVGFHV